MKLNLKQTFLRAASGLVYMALIIGCILLGPDAVAALALFLGVLSAVEFTKITRGLTARVLPVLIADIAGICCLITGVFGLPLLCWVVYFIVRMVEEIYLKDSDPLSNIAKSLMGQLYIGVPLGLFTAIGYLWATPCILLAIFSMIWINDTGAYVIGVSCGRHRFFPRISPKKSWEGFAGGCLFTIALALILCHTCHSAFGLPQSSLLWIIFAIVVSLFSTWGDLFESLLKRDLNIKDSGSIMPGHGGILDRLDSLMLVMPASALFLFIYLIA